MQPKVVIRFAVYDRETAEIRAKTQKKIWKLIRKLFPDRRLLRQPIIVLRDKGGDVFGTMRELEVRNYFWAFSSDRKLKEKNKIALEAVLYMLHYRVETYITAFPQSCRVMRVKELLDPNDQPNERYWFGLELESLREIRSQVIAMHSEGFPP